ncbi:MAG: phytanoyl-CoA dioxygenase family protein [Candidatus Handelsmanbacteria bacterium]|nr:phytanoyl-CoA dioxygenase family protein [Candidatus Handelsmanbacteria bacterium]
MGTSAILAGEPFGEEQTLELVEAFHRDGFVYIPGVLTQGEIKALRARSDELLADPVLYQRTAPELADKRYLQLMKNQATGEEIPFILRNTIELDPIFREMLVREPIFSLAEAIVGKDCRFCGQNVLRNLPGLSIDRWHTDGPVHNPLPDQVPRHDPRIRMQVLWITVQMALSDIETIEQGPTQYVPGSHYSGRGPNSQEHPEFEGRGPVSMLCKAGDIYFQDPQCWHRGAPNTSDRTRYIIQSQYAANWAYWRFSLCNRVPVPEEGLRQAGDRLLHLLGRSRPA